MRDVFLTALHQKMATDERLFFVSADFGAPILDKIRADFPDRFINVGIAEQNLINVSVGLALEGFTVYAYAIAPFITMRCYEQIRVNIAILSQLRPMNINLIGVGAGVSYSLSGPTHHCLEDLSIMRTLPNIEVFSPSDYLLTEAYVERSIACKKPKYLRFDAMPMQAICEKIENFNQGFRVLQHGSKAAIIATGYMSQKAQKVAADFDVMVIDLYFLNAYDLDKLHACLKAIETVITLEEGFKGVGGLDSEINSKLKNKQVINLGFEQKYTFEVGSREFVHESNGLGEQDLIALLKIVS